MSLSPFKVGSGLNLPRCSTARWWMGGTYCGPNWSGYHIRHLISARPEDKPESISDSSNSLKYMPLTNINLVG